VANSALSSAISEFRRGGCCKLVASEAAASRGSLAFCCGRGNPPLASALASVIHILTIGQQPSRRRCICKCDLTGYEIEIMHSGKIPVYVVGYHQWTYGELETRVFNVRQITEIISHPSRQINELLKTGIETDHLKHRLALSLEWLDDFGSEFSAANVTCSILLTLICLLFVFSS